MIRLITPAVLGRSRQLRECFLQAQPFPHIVINDFLLRDPCRALIDEFPAFAGENARNEFGEVGRKAVVREIVNLGNAYAQLDAMLRSSDFLGWLTEITGIPRLLYDPDYVGGGTHENLNGQDLDPHVDFNYHPTRGLHRRLNLILFLNPEWQEEWGGALELHRDPWNPENDMIATVLPLENRCVLFETTERSWHGFRRISIPPEKCGISRRSIAAYFYTKHRPAEDIVPAHGTLYVQRPLPDYLRPGQVLREEDLQTIRNLLERRDRQIRFLYERELQFSRALDSQTYRLVAALASPIRRLRKFLRRVR